MSYRPASWCTLATLRSCKPATYFVVVSEESESYRMILWLHLRIMLRVGKLMVLKMVPESSSWLNNSRPIIIDVCKRRAQCLSTTCLCLTTLGLIFLTKLYPKPPQGSAVLHELWQRKKTSRWKVCWLRTGPQWGHLQLMALSRL